MAGQLLLHPGGGGGLSGIQGFNGLGIHVQENLGNLGSRKPNLRTYEKRILAGPRNAGRHLQQRTQDLTQDEWGPAL